MTGSPLGGTPEAGLRSALTRWVAAGLLGPEQASAIEAYEAQRAPVAAPARQRTGVVVLGYVGAAVAVIAALFLGGEYAERLRGLPGVALLGVLAVLLGAVGAVLLRTGPERARVGDVDDSEAGSPGFGGLADFSWALSVAAAFGCAMLATSDLTRLGDTEGVFVSLLVALTLASVYRWVRPRLLEQLAQFVPFVAAVLVAMALLEDRTSLLLSPTAYGLVLWGLGMAWALLGAGGLNPPGAVAALLGLGLAGVGPLLASADDRGWLVLGVLTVAGTLVASIRTGSRQLLALGVAGLFVYVPWVLVEVLGGRARVVVPVALLALGVALLGVSVAWSRRPVARPSGSGGSGGAP